MNKNSHHHQCLPMPTLWQRTLLPVFGFVLASVPTSDWTCQFVPCCDVLYYQAFEWGGDFVTSVGGEQGKQALGYILLHTFDIQALLFWWTSVGCTFWSCHDRRALVFLPDILCWHDRKECVGFLHSLLKSKKRQTIIGLIHSNQQNLNKLGILILHIQEGELLCALYFYFMSLLI